MDPRVKRLTLQLRDRYDAFMARDALPHTLQRDICVSSKGVEKRGNAYTGHATFSNRLPLIDAYRAAKAIVRGEEMGLAFELEDECDPWDGDSPAPEYLFYAYVPDPEDSTHGRHMFHLAGLGMVGVDSLDDPYLDILKGELFAEAIEQIETENDRKATMAANELASRATFAGVGPDA